MKTSKKILSVVLALVMMVTMLSTAFVASACDDNNHNEYAEGRDVLSLINTKLDVYGVDLLGSVDGLLSSKELVKWLEDNYLNLNFFDSLINDLAGDYINNGKWAVDMGDDLINGLIDTYVNLKFFDDLVLDNYLDSLVVTLSELLSGFLGTAPVTTYDGLVESLIPLLSNISLDIILDLDASVFNLDAIYYLAGLDDGSYIANLNAELAQYGHGGDIKPILTLSAAQKTKFLAYYERFQNGESHASLAADGFNWKEYITGTSTVAFADMLVKVAVADENKLGVLIEAIAGGFEDVNLGQGLVDILFDLFSELNKQPVSTLIKRLSYASVADVVLFAFELLNGDNDDLETYKLFRDDNIVNSWIHPETGELLKGVVRNDDGTYSYVGEGTLGMYLPVVYALLDFIEDIYSGLSTNPLQTLLVTKLPELVGLLNEAVDLIQRMGLLDADAAEDTIVAMQFRIAFENVKISEYEAEKVTIQEAIDNFDRLIAEKKAEMALAVEAAETAAGGTIEELEAQIKDIEEVQIPALAAEKANLKDVVIPGLEAEKDALVAEEELLYEDLYDLWDLDPSTYPGGQPAYDAEEDRLWDLVDAKALEIAAKNTEITDATNRMNVGIPNDEADLDLEILRIQGLISDIEAVIDQYEGELYNLEANKEVYENRKLGVEANIKTSEQTIETYEKRIAAAEKTIANSEKEAFERENQILHGIVDALEGFLTGIYPDLVKSPIYAITNDKRIGELQNVVEALLAMFGDRNDTDLYKVSDALFNQVLKGLYTDFVKNPVTAVAGRVNGLNATINAVYNLGLFQDMINEYRGLINAVVNLFDNSFVKDYNSSKVGSILKRTANLQKLVNELYKVDALASFLTPYKSVINAAFKVLDSKFYNDFNKNATKALFDRLGNVKALINEVIKLGILDGVQILGLDIKKVINLALPILDNNFYNDFMKSPIYALVCRERIRSVGSLLKQVLPALDLFPSNITKALVNVVDPAVNVLDGLYEDLKLSSSPRNGGNRRNDTADKIARRLPQIKALMNSLGGLLGPNGLINLNSVVSDLVKQYAPTIIDAISGVEMLEDYAGDIRTVVNTIANNVGKYNWNTLTGAINGINGLVRSVIPTLEKALDTSITWVNIKVPTVSYKNGGSGVDNLVSLSWSLGQKVLNPIIESLLQPILSIELIADNFGEITEEEAAGLLNDFLEFDFLDGKVDFDAFNTEHLLILAINYLFPLTGDISSSALYVVGGLAAVALLAFAATLKKKKEEFEDELIEIDVA